ncbi:MAG: glycosyltransferase family 4 protein [Brumimicrobium sp.]|nr:glycosyltransferase family 4 protein [Brumimicrobium sp.]
MVGNKSKITFITNADFPYGKSGENFTRNIALGLSENNAEVQVVRYRGRMFNFKNDLSIPCQNYLFRRQPKNSLLKGFQILLNVLYTPFFVLSKKISGKDQVFIIFALKYSYELLPFLLSCRICRIPIYQVIADHYTSEKIVPIWWKKPKYFSYLFQRKFLDRYFDGIVVLSNFLRLQAIKNKVHPEKVLLIPHFIVFESLIAQPTKSKEKKVICYCGTVSVPNGITDLISAFQNVIKSYPNVELRIVGERSFDVDNFLQKEGMDQSQIIFTGFLSKTEVEDEMNISTVLVNPRRESDWADAGFPTKIGEYFATKTPVVTTMVGDLTNYFKDKKEVIFALPNNPESLASSLLFALDQHHKEAKEIGLNGYLWARENLDHIRNTKKIIDFIKKPIH